MSAVTRRHFLRTAALGSAGITAATGTSPASAPGGTKGKGPPFRLGLVTYNLAATWDLGTVLKVCQAVGVSPVELRTTHRHGVEPTLGKSDRAEVRRRFAGGGVTFWGCGTVCEFHSPDPEVVLKNIETCKQFVGLTADLGGRGVKVRPNGLPKGVPVEKTLDQIGKALVPCGKAAADAGVEIWVEVHGPGTATPAHMKTIMEACGHSAVGLTWNSNPTDVANGSVTEAFRLLRPWVRSCHINDLYKDRSGNYPYRELFGLLRSSGYDRVTLCEVGRSVSDQAAGSEFLRYYKALWEELVREG